MRPITRWLVPGVLGLTAIPTGIHAQCNTTPLWSHASTLTQLMSDTRSSALGQSYGAQGSILYAYRNTAAAGQDAGTAVWSWAPSPKPSTLNNFPSPVPMHSGGEFVFVTADDGFLYKINAASGALAGSKDLRRATCPEDKISATAALQLYQYSNATFQTAINDDLVYVVTRHGCGSSTTNRIIAMDATTLGTKWTFNLAGTSSMDYASDGCVVDHATNILYCGTHQAAAGQNTLWAINTLSGAVIWSANAGSLSNRPMLNGGRVYVASESGSIMAHQPATGAALWGSPVTLPSAVVRNPWPEFRNGATEIYLTTSDGYLRGYRDMGSMAVQLWPATNAAGVGFSTAPVYAQGKLYVGRNDGRIQQVDVATGALETWALAAPPGTLFDPTLDVGVQADALANRLMVASTNVAHRYCIPWTGALDVRDDFQTEARGARLGPSVPNPFQENTRIAFELPRAARVDLAVFDVAGKRVRTLLGQDHPAGAHTAVWDGTDETGRRSPSGVYFYRLRVEDGQAPPVEQSGTVLRVK